jgi:hypothetical protein
MEKHTREKTPHRDAIDPMVADLNAHGVSVERSATTPQHRSLNLAAFKGGSIESTVSLHRRLSDLAEVCERYLSGSIVTDSFENHAERRHLRNAMQQKYGAPLHELFERNMLKLNNLAGVYSYFEFTIATLDGARQDHEAAQRIRAIAKEMPDLSRYEQLAPAERVEIMRALQRICEQYLAVVSSDRSRKRH